METENKKTQIIRAFGEKLSKKYPKAKVHKIPVLPEVAYVEDVDFELKGLECVPIGIEKNSLEAYL